MAHVKLSMWRPEKIRSFIIDVYVFFCRRNTKRQKFTWKCNSPGPNFQSNFLFCFYFKCVFYVWDFLVLNFSILVFWIFCLCCFGCCGRLICATVDMVYKRMILPETISLPYALMRLFIFLFSVVIDYVFLQTTARILH